MPETSACCVLHMFQLVVNNGLLAQRNVLGALTVVRKIFGYFKPISLDFASLENI